MNGTRKLDGRRLTDEQVAAADDWHWVPIGTACDKLLERLERFHGFELSYNRKDTQ
jgi:hypothetical protein